MVPLINCKSKALIALIFSRVDCVMRYAMGQLSLLAIVPIAIAGCSVHPLPEDVSRVSTSSIIRKARCEAREAIIQEVNRDHGSDPSLSAYAVPRNWLQALIGWDFDFDIDEANNQGLSATLKPPVIGGSLTFNMIGANKKSRTNKRRVRIVERFLDLSNETGCKSDTEAKRQNIAYPLTGSIGVGEVIATFAESGRGKYTIESDAIASVSGAAEADSVPRSGKIVTFSKKVAKPVVVSGKVTGTPPNTESTVLDDNMLSEELTFTTESYLGDSGTKAFIEFKAADGSDAVLQAASLTPFYQQRKDLHKLTIAIAWQKSEDKSGNAAVNKLLSSVRGNVEDLPAAIAAGVTTAQTLAAADKFIVVTELNRIRQLEEDRRRQSDANKALSDLLQPLLQ